MKDVRGAHVAAVRNAIFKTFGLQTTTTIRRKNSQDILGGKSRKKLRRVTKNYLPMET